MDSEPYEGTSDGRVKWTSNGSTVEIKQEPDVKEEQLDQLEMVSRVASARVSDGFEANLEVKWELKTDDEWDLEWNSVQDPDYVKEEVKCQVEKEKKKKDSSAASDSNGRAINNSAPGNENFPLAGSKDDGQRKKRSNQNNNKKANQSKSEKAPTAKYPKKHKCTLCNYAVSFKILLMQHEQTHSSEKPFCCDICSKAFARKGDLKKHKRIHGDQFLFRCSICRQSFNCEQKKIYHENKCKVRQFICELCRYSTQYKHNLEKHVRVHSGEKPHECSICLKTFTVKENLKRHLRIHKDELPFTCSKCGQRFADDDSKQSHEKHCQNRRYECYLCGHNCLAKTHLKCHMQAKHTGEKPFECEVCHKIFNRKQNLNSHMLRHRDQSPYQCSKCGCGFPEKDLKNKHQEVCRRRQYECFLCKVIKPDKQQLKHHMLVYHTGEKPFQCEVCKASFTQKSNAKTHVKRVHGLEKNKIQKN